MLIENGHNFKDIKNYTLRQFSIFLDAIGSLNKRRNPTEEEEKKKSMTLPEAIAAGLV